MNFNGFCPAILTTYDAVSRTGEVLIPGLTDGADSGLTAKFAYPFGENDQDTELKPDTVPLPAPVYIFFEGGDPFVPVVCYWRGHQDGSAEVGTRRIRQANIELLATQGITLNAPDIELQGEVNNTGNMTVSGNAMIGTGKTTIAVDMTGKILTFTSGILTGTG